MEEMKTLRFMQNPYFSPEKCGLEIFQVIDLSEDSYQFDLFVIWIKKDDGTLWWDHDSGNSVPVPFEWADLKPITKKTFFDFEKALKSHRNVTHKIYTETLMAIKNYLKEKKNRK